MTLPRIHVLGTGSAVPERVLTNEDLSQMVETSDEWVRERTGIRARHVVSLDRGSREVAASDLAAAAGARAIAAAGLAPGDIDCVIVATISADMPLPSCAVFVQRKLGCAPLCPAFDLAAACGGFLYGLAVAEGLLRGGVYRRVLLCGVEVLSGYVDWQDRATCILFGDGAGAAVLGLGGEDGRGLHAVRLHADGAQAEVLMIPGGGSRHPPSAETVASGQHFIHMNGRAIFAHAVRNLAGAAEEALAATGWGIGDVDLLVSHQANLRIIEAVAQRLGLPMARAYVNIDRYGNTSSASVPIALDELARGGHLRPGQRLLLCALGAGLAWGAATMVW